MKSELAEPNLPISEQAAAWVFELSDGPNDLATRREFVRWLKRSPEHIEAFLAVAVLEEELSELPGDLDEALALAGEGATAALRFPGAAREQRDATRGAPAPARRRAAWLTAAAISAVAATTAALWLVPGTTDAPSVVVHRTDYGEQRSMVLADGSIVILNTLSEVAVRFGEGARRVDLVAGEAMFDVAPDSERPFLVETGAVELSVLGTRFAVYRTTDSVKLAVVEGVVRAQPRGQPEEHVLIHAGEGAVAAPNGTIRRSDRFDIEKAIAWTERRLVFDEVPLEAVVTEFNRYNRRPLIVQDPELAERKITSVFFANDVSALIAFLELEPDVEVDYGADAIRIRSKN